MYSSKLSIFNIRTLLTASVLAISAIIPAIVSPASAETRVLGETRLSPFFNDTDIVRVGSCSPRIERLQLRVKGADAKIEALAVKFQNGQVQRIDVRSNIPKGSSSRWISLPGDSARCIDKIGIMGSSVVSSEAGLARVQFVGEHGTSVTNNLPGAQTSRQLGSTKLSLFANDTDVVRVNSCQPRITSLQLQAKNADANLKSVVVTFGNGEKQTLDVRSTLKKDQYTRWIPLDGRGGRCVTQIRVLGDTAFNFQFSPARVVFYGK
ncbi:MAG TPA: DUF2541 family protein [Stenomitos sp.]